MPRPEKLKRVERLPRCCRFSGQRTGECVPQISISVEEFETLRQIDYQGRTQAECAQRMGVGRSTVQALYNEARKKVARFLVEGAELTITGGLYTVQPREGRSRQTMKVAVTYEDGQVFQHFGHTQQFKIYDVEDGEVVRSQVVDTNGSGHGALAGFLKELGVQVLICGGIGGGARLALSEAGIALYGGASGDADAQVQAFAEGSLFYDPDALCMEHGAGHGCGHHHEDGHGCGHHHEGGHGCGHHSGQEGHPDPKED